MARGETFAYHVMLFLSTLMYSSSTEFKMQLRREIVALRYLVYCHCSSEKIHMALCARKGSVVSALDVGSTTRAAAEAHVVM